MRELPVNGGSIRDRNFSINQLIRGRSNASGTVTLTASATTTVITSEIFNEDAGIFLCPTTANAAAELAAGTCYASTIAAGSVTLTHANNAQTDRTFRYVVIGG